MKKYKSGKIELEINDTLLVGQKVGVGDEQNKFAQNPFLTEFCADITVVGNIGEGGQGVVYRVQCGKKIDGSVFDSGTHEYALKWYPKGESNAFYTNLLKNLKKSPGGTFIWPLAVTEKIDDAFGYVMDIIPSEYKELASVIENDYYAEFKHDEFEQYYVPELRETAGLFPLKKKVLLAAAMRIAYSFMLLHRGGFAYQDVNLGNIFLNPKNGRILICDNDNVATDGENFGIKGSEEYMAPEVCKGVRIPDAQSDKFSLSVLLFTLLFYNHPLRGQNDNVNMNDDNPVFANDERLYVTNPVFIYDEEDTSNRPKPCHEAVITRWPLYPKFLHEEFKKAFKKDCMRCDGVERYRSYRLQETEWLSVFARLCTCLITCPKCGKEIFFNLARPQYECKECHEVISRPFVMIVDENMKNSIALQARRKIHRFEIDGIEFYTPENAIFGKVIESKTNQGMYAIKNMSAFNWIVKNSGEDECTLKKGEIIRIYSGTFIDFGNAHNASII